MKNVNRQRLINAIVFFAQNTRYCGKIKLFKLLYLLDFEHFRQTGRSVTGYDYEAWKFGPVPSSLMEEWEELEPDLAHAVRIEPEKVIDYARETVKVNPGVAFDDSEFTPRQLDLMRTLADKYRDIYSGRLIDVTHEQNGAWDKVWANGEGSHHRIPYHMAIPADSPDRELLLTTAAEALGRSKPLPAGEY